MIPVEFNEANYLNLSTFRKTGVAVNTPVWFAHDGKHIYVLSAGNAGKIKRLKNSSRSAVAHCTYSGKLLGNWHPATGLLIDAEQARYAHGLFVKKYGLQMRAFDFFSWLGGRITKRIYIKLTIDQGI